MFFCSSSTSLLLLLLFSISISLTSPSPFGPYSTETVAEPLLPPCTHPERYSQPNWILQFADHFTDLDPTVWRLRFFSNLDHFQFGGPVLLLIGGPWEISPHFVCNGLLVDVAKRTRAALFYLEHRFYGQSHPVNGNTRELSLLTRAQAIEDIRHFVEHQRTHTLGMAKSRVVLIGAHLGGSLAAWVQQKYPGLVQGVWAHGAPFTADDGVAQFEERLRLFVRSSAAAGGGQKCTLAMDEVFRVMRREMDDGGGEELKEIFNACSSPDFDLQQLHDQSTFLFRLSSAALTRPLLEKNVEVVANELCPDLLDVQYLDKVEAFAAHFVDRYWQLKGAGEGNRGCIDYSFKGLLNATVKDSLDPWSYQSCTEFGWFPVATKEEEDSWLPSSSFFDAMCFNAFSVLDEERRAAQAETRQLMEAIAGGETPLVLTYGELDPWTGTGLKELRGEERHLLMIPGDPFQSTVMRSLHRKDSLDMQRAKIVLLNQLERWTGSGQGRELLQSNESGGGGSELLSFVGVFLIVTVSYFLSQLNTRKLV